MQDHKAINWGGLWHGLNNNNNNNTTKTKKYGNIRLKPFLHAKIYNLKSYPFLAF
jgi:hypothetical protein